jgi:hypothetical protein
MIVRIFLAGASSAIGVRLLPLLVAAGREVAGMTRSPGKGAQLRALEAAPVLCDVYDADALREAVARYQPEAVMHQLTDLPDDVARGVVIRYGQLHGAGTYFETEQPPPPRIQIEEAARRTVELLHSSPGIVEVVDVELAREPHATSSRD